MVHTEHIVHTERTERAVHTVGSDAPTAPVLIGVLALQGGVEEHERIIKQLGAQTRRVRVPKDLDGLDGIILPGGESTVFDKLARTFGLAGPLKEAIRNGLPTFATCAGLIYAARRIDNPASGQETLAVLDVTVKRNAFGSQRHSSERIITIDGHAIECSFIRAPIVTQVGEGVEVLATTTVALSDAARDVASDSAGDAAGETTGDAAGDAARDAASDSAGDPTARTTGEAADYEDRAEEVIVAVRQGNITAVSFHPEEHGDTRLHSAWLRHLGGADT